MRVRLLTPMLIRGARHEAGEVVETDPPQAQRWMRRGLAEPDRAPAVAHDRAQRAEDATPVTRQDKIPTTPEPSKPEPPATTDPATTPTEPAPEDEDAAAKAEPATSSSTSTKSSRKRGKSKR